MGLNHDRNRAPKPDSFLAALWHACSRPSATTRAASASASLRLAVSSDSRAAFVSAFARSASAVARAASSFTRCRAAFARSASAVARPASSFTRCRAASASASLRWANASDAFAVKTSDFAPSSSFFGAPVSDTDGSFVAVGCEVCHWARVGSSMKGRCFSWSRPLRKGWSWRQTLEPVHPGTFPDR